MHCGGSCCVSAAVLTHMSTSVQACTSRLTCACLPQDFNAE